MLTPKQVIATYEHVAGITGRMVEAAQNADWDQLVTLEQKCSRLVATLELAATPVTLSPQQQQRKTGLIRQVLAADAEIRRHTEPWIDELKLLLDSAGKAQRVRRAYGSGSVPT
jgi:flagellar protein FliT